MKPFISACLIVKNEESMLRRCLESLQGAVDEIVIVDTGSTDATKEIAREFTQHVYDFVWIQDFSAARNFAAGKASGEWILSVDADEYADRESLEESLRYLRDSEGIYDRFTVTIISFVGEQGEGTVTSRMGRIYKRNTVQYGGAIHEQLVSQTRTDEIGELPLILYHYGYLNRIVQSKKKNKRNLEIIQRELRSGKATGFTYYNYGQELMNLERWEEALQAFMTAYERKPSIEVEWAVLALLAIVEILAALKRYEEALSIARQAEQAWSDSLDFLFWRGEIYRLQGRSEDAKEIFHFILTQPDKKTIRIADAKKYLPHERLGVIFEKEREFQQAMHHYVSAINVKGPIENLVVRVAIILSMHHSAKEAADFLERHRMVAADQIRLEVIKALLHRGQAELPLLLLTSAFEQDVWQAVRFKADFLSAENPQHIAPAYTEDTLLAAVNQGIADLGDLSVLYYYTRWDSIERLFQGTSFKHLLPSLFTEGKAKASADQYLQVLDKAVAARKFACVEYLVAYAGRFRHQLDAKIADLFYLYGYEEIAMDLYQSAPGGQMTKQGYENMILWRLKHGAGAEAVRIAKEALRRFPADFRFYPYVIEHSEAEADRSEFVRRGLERFPDSSYLSRHGRDLGI